MEDNMVTKVDLDVKRLIDRDESLKCLLEFYDPKEIISVYIYDLIASIIISYVNNIKLKEINKKLDSYLTDLILKYKDEEYIEMKGTVLKELIEAIKYSKISELSIKSFLVLYCTKEKIINDEYKKNLSGNLKQSKTSTWKFCYKVKPQDKLKSKWTHEEMLTKIIEESSRKVFEQKYGVTVTSVKNNKTNELELVGKKSGKKVK